jgi:hypothetical protein
MAAEVRILKFDAGSVTDKKLQSVSKALNAANNAEAFRRGIALAEYVVEARSQGKKILIEEPDGTRRELVIG